MNANLLKIINYYGIHNQQRKLQEEVFELQEAITELNMAERDMNIFDIEQYKEHIKEELADVVVLINEIAEYYGIEHKDIFPIMEFKIDRTLKRMED